MPGAPRPRLPRPLADAPVDALLDRAEELAKGWLLALIEERALSRAPALAGGELAREGPAVCAAVVRALRSDAELDPLESLARQIGRLADAGTPAELSRAVELLRAVVWSALLAELRDPDGSFVAALADRLAHVCETVRGAALSATRDWREAIEAAVGRARDEGAELSVLLVELDDADRMLAAGSALPELGAVVRGVVAGVAVEQDGARVWVICPGVDRGEGERLAAAIAAAVGHDVAWGGAPLRANVGVATFGVEAEDAAGLIDAAERASLAAAARGIEVARATDAGGG